MCQALGLRLGYQMVNVLLSRKVESNNLESNNVARWQKKTKKKPQQQTYRAACFC